MLAVVAPVAPTVPAPTAAALVPAWIGARAYAADGARIGHVADVLFDARTRAPGWLLLCLPRAVERYVLAPAGGLRHRIDGVELSCDRERVRSAPPSEAPPDSLAMRTAATLAAHYGIRCGAGPWHGVVEPSLVGTGGRMRAGRPV